MAPPQTTVEQQLVQRRRRPLHRLSSRERLVVPLAGLAYALACAGLWVVDPPHHVRYVATAAACAVMVLASRVRFETPFGFAMATQLAFVPLLLALPAAVVPVATCLAVVLGVIPDVVVGRLRPARLVYVLPNCWFAIGPAWVFALAHGRGGTGAPTSDVAVLLAALAAEFVVDFAASSTIQHLTGSGRIGEQLRDTWVYLVDAGLSGIGWVVAEQTLSSPLAVLAIAPLLGLLAVFARERSGRLQKLVELSDTYRGAALLLGEVVEADDAYTGRHSHGVVELALAVGDVLGLGPERRRNLEFSALLHDVGKIAIPKPIITKPARLDPAEWALVKTHAAEGQRMLTGLGGFMAEVGVIVRSHHERWDGGGYPDGLVAEQAPLESRIITACDSWSAMRTDRAYRTAMSHHDAVAEVVRNRGTQFDPRVVAALLSVVERSPSAAGPASPRPACEPPAGVVDDDLVPGEPVMLSRGA